MKRLLIVSVAALALMAGTVFVVSAQTPQQNSFGCPGWGAGAAANNGYAASPMYGIVAGKLGLSADQLAVELKAGKSVADVAAEKGVKVDDLIQAIDAPMDEMMDVMARYGYMSQEQIDSMKEYRSTMHRQALEQKGGFGPMMGGGMMGGMMGRGGMMGGLGGFGGMMRGFTTN